MSKDTMVYDLPFAEAMVRVLQACSIGGGDFHLGKLIMIVEIREGHDQLIIEWKRRMSSSVSRSEFYEQVLASLERKKREVQDRKAKEAEAGDREKAKLNPFPDDPHERM
jgi:hypothetical protein